MLLLLHLTGWPWSKQTERRTKAERCKVDSLFATSMLVAHTQSKLMDSVSKLSNFLTWWLTITSPRDEKNNSDLKNSLRVCLYLYINNCTCSVLCVAWRSCRTNDILPFITNRELTTDMQYKDTQKSHFRRLLDETEDLSSQTRIVRREHSNGRTTWKF